MESMKWSPAHTPVTAGELPSVMFDVFKKDVSIFLQSLLVLSSSQSPTSPESPLTPPSLESPVPHWASLESTVFPKSPASLLVLPSPCSHLFLPASLSHTQAVPQHLCHPTHHHAHSSRPWPIIPLAILTSSGLPCPVGTTLVSCRPASSKGLHSFSFISFLHHSGGLLLPPDLPLASVAPSLPRSHELSTPPRPSRPAVSPWLPVCTAPPGSPHPVASIKLSAPWLLLPLTPPWGLVLDGNI